MFSTKIMKMAKSQTSKFYQLQFQVSFYSSHSKLYFSRLTCLRCYRLIEYQCLISRVKIQISKTEKIPFFITNFEINLSQEFIGKHLISPLLCISLSYHKRPSGNYYCIGWLSRPMEIVWSESLQWQYGFQSKAFRIQLMTVWHKMWHFDDFSILQSTDCQIFMV